MKEVKAYVRVFMIGNVIQALRHEGYHRVTVIDVSAVTDPLWKEERQLDPDLGLHTRMAKLELICKDDQVETVLSVVRAAAHTGNRGDGVIFVSTVEECMQIRTGNKGVEAL